MTEDKKKNTDDGAEWSRVKYIAAGVAAMRKYIILIF